MELKDLYWLAGLLEGEGCFTYSGSTPMVQLQMTDKDVVERASLLLKGSLGRRTRETYTGKIAWFTQLSGSKCWMDDDTLSTDGNTPPCENN